MPLLAAAAKRPLPVPGDVVDEGRNNPRVGWHCVIREIPAHHLTQPASLLGQQHVQHVPQHFSDLDRTYLHVLTTSAQLSKFPPFLSFLSRCRSGPHPENVCAG